MSTRARFRYVYVGRYLRDVGGWWGKGGRTGKISSLLLGLRVEQEDDGSGSTPV